MKKKNVPHVTLSKSKIKQNEQCELMAWHELNNRSQKTWDTTNEFLFEQGREVEQIARNSFPNTVLQDKQSNWDKILYTKELLKTNKTIFEAAFAKKSCIIQFDMLTPNADSTYDAVEVKSSAQFKPDYESDVLIQYWIATMAGIKINKFELWYVNKTAKSISDNYFVKNDVTEFVRKNERRFWELLTRATKTSKLDKAPDIKIGPHCKKHDCPFRGTNECKLTKTPDSVLALPRFSGAFKAYHEGITSVNDPRFDEKYDYTKTHEHVIKSIRENQLVILREPLEKDFSTWKFPLNMFDFEAVMSAIPLLQDQTPYSQMVFQFSNHLYNGHSDTMTHTMFLHDNLTNPGRGVVEAMLNCLEANEGSIVAYNAPYEKTRIKELALQYSQYSDRLLKLNERFVDLMDLIKDNVYHPEFMGSYSLKKVSVALLKEYGSYSDSLIKNGGEIAKYYVEMLTTKDEVRKQLIKDALIRYCSYDTLNLFLVLKYILDPSVDLKRLVELNLNTSN